MIAIDDTFVIIPLKIGDKGYLMLDLETIMMLFFLIALVISIWKIYVFLPKKQLVDDDTTGESIEELTELMVLCITESYAQGSQLTHTELFEQMTTHERFDKEHYWRFNLNRLNHLVGAYYAQNPDILTLQEIYEAENRRKR